MKRKSIVVCGLMPMVIMLMVAMSFGQATIDPPVNDLDLEYEEVFNETVTVNIPGGECPIPKADIFFMSDTTGSMGGVIGGVQDKAEELLNAISSTPGLEDVQYGVGEYKDYPYDPFAYRTNQPMTSNTAAVINAINMWGADGGEDGSEANLYALYYVANNDTGFRADAKKIIVWFGDAPGHDPVPDSFTGLGFDLVEADTINALQSRDITVIALNATTGFYALGLDDDPTFDASNYPLPRNGSPGQATRISGATNGQLFTIDSSGSDVIDAILEAIGKEVCTIDVLTLEPNGDTMGFTTAISPPQYTDVDPTSGDISLPFEVTFTGVVECSDDPFNYTLDAVGDGAILVSKIVNISVPPCGCDDCGNGCIDHGEQCDGDNLNGKDCICLGFDGGTLACAEDCTFDTSGCFIGGTCGNGCIDPGEDCDGDNLGGYNCECLGFDGGVLACNEDCTFDTSGCGTGTTTTIPPTTTTTMPVTTTTTIPPTTTTTTIIQCGDGIIEPPEVCDGDNLDGAICEDFGFDGGDLACSDDCLSFDTSECFFEQCGNGIIDPGEDCDGDNLNGETCETLGFDGGVLACDDCIFDTTGCFITTTTTTIGECGDGSVDPGEDCDPPGGCCGEDCKYLPEGTSCPDGEFCNGEETCDAIGNCVPGTLPDCDDGVDCTDDICDEDADVCVNNPNDGNCIDDGLYCTGVEFCDPVNGCSSSGNPCDVGEECDEDTNSCSTEPSVAFYCKDFLEGGNPGGWGGSLKTFDDEWALSPGGTVDMDIWTNDVPQQMLTSGCVIVYDPALLDITNVTPYDSDNGGPWDPALTTSLGVEPGVWVLALGNLACVTPDADGDVILGKATVERLQSGNATITVVPIPDFDTVLGCDGTLYDSQIPSNIVTINDAIAMSACSGDFDFDNDVDGSDAAILKADFGRNSFNNPCTNDNPCNADFDCNGNVDGSDTFEFKVDFGRSAYNNPCPIGVSAETCTY